MTNDKKKILELESLRGLAALLVVLFHLPKWNPILDINLINNSYLMVELFFVISGFVIFKAYSERITSWFDLLKFQFLRFGRLYPLHLLFLLIFLGLEIMKFIGVSRYGLDKTRVPPFSMNNAAEFIEHIFLLQAVLPYSNTATFNAPSWSISVEFYTYIIFGLIILLFKRVKTLALALLCTVAMLLLITQSTFGMEPVLRGLAGFFLGTLTAHLVGKRSVSLPKYTSLLILLLMGIYLQLKMDARYDFVIFFLTAALIASLVLNTSGWLNNILSKKPLTWLGEVSYSVYMSHVFIIWVATNFLKRVLKRTEVQGLYGAWAAPLSLFETLVAVTIIVFLIFITSQILYLRFEKPFREWSRGFISSQKPT